MKKPCLALCLVFALLFGGCAPSAEEGEGLKVIYIDVGEGDATLLIGPTGKTMLIDGGSASARESVLAQLASAGVETLDVMLATHPDEDHIGGLPTVLARYPVNDLYANGRADTAIFHSLESAARARGLMLLQVEAGERIPWEAEAEVRVLGPAKVRPTDSSNNQSAIVQVVYGGHRFLFTGDAEHTSEAEAVARYGKGLASTVYQVGHHGSSTSSSPAFVQAVAPEVAIVSVGPNSYGHPDRLVLRRLALAGAEVYSTEASGTIRLRSDGTHLYIRAEKSDRPLEINRAAKAA